MTVPVSPLEFASQFQFRGKRFHLIRNEAICFHMYFKLKAIRIYFLEACTDSVALSRPAMVVGPETSDVTNDQEPERHCEQGAKTAALPAGYCADMRALVRRLSVESASSGRNDVRASSVGRSFDGAPVGYQVTACAR